jgi:hypothetical protein
MLDQFNSIAQAAEMLVGRDGTPHERIAKGFSALRRATMFNNDWSVELWEKYNCICNTLLAGGTWQRTIARMDTATASKCATHIYREMKNLAFSVEVARRHAMAPHFGVPLEPVEEF